MNSLNTQFFFMLALVALASKAETKKPEKFLSEGEARERASKVSGIHYELNFRFDQTEENFSGVETLQFELSDNSKALNLDFIDGHFEQLELNGKKIAPDYDGHFLSLPATALTKGPNTLIAHFAHPYSAAGNGLYRFKDPQDGRVYLYTDFEPYDANLLFPCFDQPDLKADYKLKVEVPANWIVVSSTLEDSVTAKGARKVWSFPRSERFSTYLFAIAAGPFHVWKGQSGSIPMRLLARESLARYVDAKDWLKITDQGLKFYGNYFDYAYPFKKYDQIIVPDFNAGAMENVAAVTFTEHMVERSKATLEERESRSDTILHEMAHMWFGDLVTMAWWNDLWLNESFATYMSHLALAEGTEFKRAWISFFGGSKQWAYWEDRLVTTHPIETPVASTDQATANFDGITYGKGASVLKQLSFYLTPEKFRAGVRSYFKKHDFRNARREDFMGALTEASGIDLSKWTTEWLQSEGLNELEAQWKCAEGKITEFALAQRAEAEHPTLRSHRTQIGLYKKSGDHIVLAKAVPATYSGALTSISQLVGEPCPYFVYPNYGDEDYAKVKIDPTSLEAVRHDIAHIQDPLARTMAWHSLWQMVRDGEWPLAQYADLAMQTIAAEKDMKILEEVLDNLDDGVVAMMPHATRDEAHWREDYMGQLEKFYWKNLLKTAPGSDEQKRWFDGYVDVAEFQPALERLVGFLNDKEKLRGFELDQDRRWSLIYHLSFMNHPQAEALRIAEAKRDTSALGEKEAIASEVALPRIEIKKRWFQTIVANNEKLPLAKLRSAMRGMFPRGQEKFRMEFANEFFEKLPQLEKSEPSEFISRFVAHLVPADCLPGSPERLAKYISLHPEFTPVVMKKLRVAQQEEGRCLKIKQMAFQGK